MPKTTYYVVRKMVLVLMNKSLEIFLKYKGRILLPLFFIVLSITIFQLYKDYFGYHITAKFAESGPLYNNMPVYYRGYKIGKAINIKLSEDYKHTLVTIVLSPKKPKLPEDIVAKVKHHNVRKEYIDLINQDSTTTALLKNGSVIDGEAAFDLEAFLSDIADSGVIVPLLQTFSDTLVSLDKTSAEIKNFFSDSRLILKDNKENLRHTTENAAQAAKNLSLITSRFNRSVSEDKLNNTTSSVYKSSTNILDTTENIKEIVKSVNNATKNLDKTMSKIDCTISQANDITSNVKVITGGFCEVLGKRFAGLRIIFGKPINNSKCPKHCSK